MFGGRASFSCRFAVLVLLLVHASTSYALSCEFQTVELTYEQSSSVFLAQIVSSELIGHDGNVTGINRNSVRHRFRIIESFKGEVDYDSFETGFSWPDKIAHFAVGDINLFFMGDVPGFSSCSPRYLLGQQDTANVLQKLRDYKNGVIESVSGAWTTKSESDRCSIHTAYLLPETSSSVSLSIAHVKATKSTAEHSSLWVYSHSKRASDVINDAGLVISLAGTNIAVPYAGSSFENSANFFSRIDVVNGLLTGILAREPVVMEGATRSKNKVEIPILLNGGSAAISEFALCSNLELDRTQSQR